MNHFEITLDPNKEINPKDQENMINALQKAGIIEDARILHQEIENEEIQEKLRGLKQSQETLKNIQASTEVFGNVFDILSNSKTLEPIIKPLKIVIGRSGNLLSFIDAIIEFQKTKDAIKVSLKVGASLIASKIFQIGTAYSVSGAIITFLAISITGLGVVGGTILGAVVLIAGVGVSWWISKEAEKFFEKLGNSMMDYIREFDAPFTSEEIAQLNLAHCHKTMNAIQEYQRRIFINGKEVSPFDIHPNPYILPNKTIIPKGFSSTWMSITLEQIEQIKEELGGKE